MLQYDSALPVTALIENKTHKSLTAQVHIPFYKYNFKKEEAEVISNVFFCFCFVYCFYKSSLEYMY